MIVITIVDIGHIAHLENIGEDVYAVDYLAPAIRLVTFVYAAILLELNLKKGLSTSGLLFLFWLFLSLCEAVQYRDEIIRATDTVSDVYFIY
ncbi:hypothetical protein J437_LFUL019651 [Ladona fulva]|uniref:Uncharacterized protein n=1 Tax=Ladona fulva TaxID=123851 RepID=A0A8K0PEA0_LADFU|nr:hypothetical protein J437_LFUL019651 [Ladona fulva]